MIHTDNKMKTLVLFRNVDEYYFDHIKTDGVDVAGVFTKTNKLTSFFMKTAKKLRLPMVRLFYGDWYRKMEQYDKIIVFDIAFLTDHELLSNISRKAHTNKLFFYSWNMVNDLRTLELEKRETKKAGFRFFNYDRGSCKKYDLQFNTIMYDTTLKLEKTEVRYDTLFLGFLKDRKEKMLALYDLMGKVGLRPHFVIVGTDERNLPFECRDEYVKYYDYLQMLAQSQSILDISQENQDGYSMRVMEAIFFDKKLISTNKFLLDSQFYDPNNILVIELGKTSMEEISNFFDLEFHLYSEDVKKYYSFEAWIERFV